MNEKRNKLVAAEKKRREEAYRREADGLVMAKFRPQARFKVVQAQGKNAALCSMLTLGPYGIEYPGGELFAVEDKSLIFVDGEWAQADLYWAGTYSYQTVAGVMRTVNFFVLDRELAQMRVRRERNLYDRGESAGSAEVPDNSRPERTRGFKSCGSGFLVTEDGYIISNAHVVQGITSGIRVVTRDRQQHSARVIATDPDNDIVLLKIDGSFDSVRFSSDPSAKPGQKVFTVGFPFPKIQGSEPKVTVGVVSSLTGDQDDVRRYQIDAAVQPGNSGGPLADENGNVIGVVSSRLNDTAVLLAAGALPQNVNYAVKKAYVMALIEAHPEVSATVGTPRVFRLGGAFERAVERVQKAAVQILVY